VINLLGDNILPSKDQRVEIMNFVSKQLTAKTNLADQNSFTNRLLTISKNLPSDEMIETLYRLTVNDRSKTSYESFEAKILKYQSQLMNLPLNSPNKGIKRALQVK
jgi:hypothetical protein